MRTAAVQFEAMSCVVPRIRSSIVALTLLVASRSGGAEPPGSSPTSIPLPTSKTLLLPIPGAPHPAGGFPTTIALHPGGRYVALLDGGYGMHDSDLRQGIVVL